MIYTVRTPFFLKLLFPQVITRVRTSEKHIYLTFDDGPIPEVTPWVLNQLKEYNAKATFFCIGDNVHKHPEIYQQILENGHSVGNHTFNHVNGWHTKLNEYLENVSLCESLVQSNLFRPPYGRMKYMQYRALKNKYSIIMWNVLSGDFDPNILPEKCFNNVVKNTKNGSIIVFHDSIKASKILYETLPKILKHYADKGYAFVALPVKNASPLK